ncbi:hypothetical protein BO86DRAFT_439756 [Aspergillus japonicus CBS 114.51]|uniref:CCHC-type domain-containing protein n=1 Tax=Aspergillus japonicus CBS 114.51 TaxID=1448312 RepID=A0A8T8WQC1_ASPJA|nr:hypothetical protein BO86DRAFT_439756 [Aspergillus japonicus CBS 114.51]RAH77863.1 hypothetical protein BO86DRAFT_439756 [Aspergillus japonicus CBS 114.51]
MVRGDHLTKNGEKECGRCRELGHFSKDCPRKVFYKGLMELGRQALKRERKQRYEYRKKKEKEHREKNMKQDEKQEKKKEKHKKRKEEEEKEKNVKRQKTNKSN